MGSVNQVFLNLRLAQLTSKVKNNQGYQSRNAAPGTLPNDLVTVSQLKGVAPAPTVAKGSNKTTIISNPTLGNLNLTIATVSGGSTIFNFGVGSSFRVVLPHGSTTAVTTSNDPTTPLLWIMILDQDSTGGGAALFGNRFKNMPALASLGSPALTRCTQLMLWDGSFHYPVPQLDQPI
jgi:hypothetical protein